MTEASTLFQPLSNVFENASPFVFCLTGNKRNIKFASFELVPHNTSSFIYKLLQKCNISVQTPEEGKQNDYVIRIFDPHCLLEHPDEIIQIPFDCFLPTYLFQSVIEGNFTLVDLNKHRFTKSEFEKFDANLIADQKVGWSQLKHCANYDKLIPSFISGKDFQLKNNFSSKTREIELRKRNVNVPTTDGQQPCSSASIATSVKPVYMTREKRRLCDNDGDPNSDDAAVVTLTKDIKHRRFRRRFKKPSTVADDSSDDSDEVNSNKNTKQRIRIKNPSAIFSDENDSSSEERLRYSANTHKASTMPSKSKKLWTASERNKVLSYIARNELYEFMHGNCIYKSMEALKIVPNRSWSSIREHISKVTLKTHPEYVNESPLTKEQKKKILEMSNCSK